jgi:hypothetical protein
VKTPVSKIWLRHWRRLRTYVGRILRLTSLAPQIVERILNEDEPPNIILAKLRSDLPFLWAEQTWG